MGRSLDKVMKDLPASRRKKVEKRGAELIAETMNLRALRQKLNLTQEDLAAALNTKQGSISKVEKRSDMLISTLRAHIEAMGGELELVAKIPGQPPVKIDAIQDLTESHSPA